MSISFNWQFFMNLRNMKFQFIKLLPLIILALFSCSRSADRRNSDVSDIKIEKVKIARYEQALFGIDKSNLKTELEKLQPQYPMFLDGDLNDSSNLKRISDYLTDTLLISVFKDCQQRWPDISILESELTEAFRHYKYYYPNKKLPDVYTYISGFDYEYPVQYFDDHLLIAIDLYLGADYPRYKKLGLANYILKRFDKEYLIRDCMLTMARTETDLVKGGTVLLNLMIREGKLIWFTGILLPDLSESVLLDYTESQWQWAKKGESTVWAFLIENEMLYTSEMQPVQKFLGDAPFTSYFGSESPPDLGTFIGWQIITSYMNRHPDITVEELMKNYNAQEILNQSGYKPKL